MLFFNMSATTTRCASSQQSTRVTSPAAGRPAAPGCGPTCGSPPGPPCSPQQLRNIYVRLALGTEFVSSSRYMLCYYKHLKNKKDKKGSFSIIL